MIAANVKSLIEQPEAGHSDALTAYLNAMSRFHSYSFGNVLEIARQRSTATRVAGMYAWNQFDRRVKKGEKGIRILFVAGGIPRSHPANLRCHPCRTRIVCYRRDDARCRTGAGGVMQTTATTKARIDMPVSLVETVPQKSGFRQLGLFLETCFPKLAVLFEARRFEARRECLRQGGRRVEIAKDSGDKFSAVLTIGENDDTIARGG